MPPDDDARMTERLLTVIEDEIVPLTRVGVARGDKVFGAAILAKADLSLVVAGTNEETENPLWHGEMTAIRRFHELPAAARPAPADCLFLATHEPCSLCLSAITWAGFDNFHYFFPYESTAEDFAIPHDLRILDEVFSVADGAYRRRNAFWTAHSLPEAIAALSDAARAPLERRAQKLRTVYGELSATYQAHKGEGEIPLP